MADLPADRVTPGQSPFTSVGIDCFGPLRVRRGRSLVKRYGVIFTCLAPVCLPLRWCLGALYSKYAQGPSSFASNSNC